MGQSHSHRRPSAAAATPCASARQGPMPSFICKLRDTLVARCRATEPHSAGITRRVFVTVFLDRHPAAADVLFDHFLRLSACVDDDCLPADDFAERCQEVCQLVTDHEEVNWYVRAFADEHENVPSARLRDLVLQAFESAMWAHPASEVGSLEVDTCLGGVVESCMHGRGEVSTAFVRNWVLLHCPRLLSWLHRYVVERITVGGSVIPASETEPEPEPAGHACVLESASASSAASLHPALLWLLMCSLPDLYTRPSSDESLPSLHALSLLDPGHSIERMVQSAVPKHWVSLYNSDDQGLSANRFQHHVLTYRGPTITLLRAEEGRLLCVAADCGWRDSPHCWGGVDCMALQLLPHYQVLTAHCADVMFYNSLLRGLPTGLRVGADRKAPAIEMDGEMAQCKHSGMPFRLHCVEVWGCGASVARDSQLKSQKRDQASAEQRRKVNVMADTNWTENPDRYLLEMSGAHHSYSCN